MAGEAGLGGEVEGLVEGGVAGAGGGGGLEDTVGGGGAG